MKEIKFRVWDKEEKKYYTVINLPCDPFKGIFSDIGIVVERPADLENDAIDVHFSGLVIEQYTGLEDKNWKQIFEGDILKWIGNSTGLEYIKPVIFYKGAFCCEIPEIENYVLAGRIESKFEVIGNINENPELLEEKK